MSAPPQTQPKRYRFTLTGFLSLPRRLCSPPAAVGKVRSFGLTPIFDVKLEDVLNRKHLPPLSLKDFEEWLLYVEQSVENLYFILWLREYSAKYETWITKVRTRDAKARRHAQNGTTYVQSAYRVAWSTTTPTSPALALFFSRARDTFLVPGAPYELSLPPALLDALAVVNGHPDPAVLAPARAHVENALRASLSRCVRAAYSNVGAYRAACGIAAGIFITLVGTVPALSVNFVRGQSRWERLVILPGLWLGLTIFIASLRGICMMIYIFGDFRQLRKFELVRPSPPASPRESEAYEFDDDDDDDESGFPAVSAPRRPVRALTAPPKIAIRIPTRTPTLSYGTTSVSLTTDVSFSGIGTGTSNSGFGTDSSYTNTSHTHTISISSLKSRGGASSLGLGHRYSSGYTYASSDTDTRSVPPYVSDDERGDETDLEDAMSSNASDHGIYISPAMPSPEDDAEDDPAVVNAALALIASGAAEGYTPSPTAGPPPQHPGLPTSVPSSATIKTQALQTVSQTPTASFIPPFSYSDAGSTQRRHSRSHSRSRSRDLEAGIRPAPSAVTASAVPTFDFEGLPPPPPPPLLPPPPASAHRRTHDPVVYVDTTNELPVPVDEKMLASPSSGYNLGLTTGTGTDCDPISPARWDDATRLYEKAPEYDPSSPRAGRRSHRPFRLSPLFRLPSLVSVLMSFRPFSSSHSGSSSSSSSSPTSYTNSFDPRGWRTRCAIESHVPAFGPVTRVLAPVVARAQWEIVVRAGIFAALLGVGASCVVVALPVPRR